MTRPTLNSIARWGLRALLGLFFLVLLALLALPWLLNRTAVGAIVLHEIEQHTGADVTVDEWHVHVFPSLGVEMRGLQARDRATSTPSAVVEQLTVSLQWLPLLAGQVVGNDVVVDRLSLTVHRLASGGWSLGSTPPAPPSERTEPSAGWLPAVRHLLITGASVTIVDDAQTLLREPIRLDIAQATILSELPGKYAKLQLSGEIPQGPDRAAVTVTGLLSQSSAREPLQVESELRVTRLNLRRTLALVHGLEVPVDGLDGPAQLTARLRWSPRPEGGDLTVDEWAMTLSDLALRGTAVVAGLDGPQPHYALSLSGEPMTVTRLLSQMPSIWVSPEQRARLATYGVDGLVSLQALTITGSLATGALPTVRGRMEIRNGRFVPHPQYPPVEAVTAQIVYEGERIRLTGVRGQCGPFRVTGEHLVITEWMRAPQMDVQLRGTASLSELVDRARRIEGIPILERLLPQVRQATGEVAVEVHVAGRLTDQRLPDVVEATLVVQNGALRGPLLPLPLQQVEARFSASPTHVKIDQLEGRFGPARFDAQGAVSLGRELTLSGVALRMEADADDVRTLFQADETAVEALTMEGTAGLQAVVTGTLNAPRLKGTLDLTRLGLQVPNVVTKPLLSPAAVEFDARLSGGTRVLLHALRIKLPPVQITGQGAIDLAGAQPFSIEVTSNDVAVSRLPRGMRLGPVQAGTLNAALHLEGRAQDRSSWQAKGQAQFEQGTVQPAGFPQPIRGLTMELRLHDDTVQIPRIAFQIGSSRFKLSGSIAHWASVPKARLVIESSELDLGLLQRAAHAHTQTQAPGPSAPAAVSEDPWWKQGSLEAFLFADHLTYQQLLVTDLSTRITWRQGLWAVERISGDTNDGHVKGRLKLRALGPYVQQAIGGLQLSGVPVDHLLSLLEQDPILSGWLTVSGKVQTELTSRNGPVWGTLESRQPIQVLVENGRIQRMPLITALLSVMNLPALLEGEVNLERDGMPFDRIKTVASVAGGVVTIRELLLDGPVLKISGSGRYDIAGDQFDMTLATSPLGSYSDLLKRIPLFGHLFAGNREGFDTAVFEVKGPAGNPRLRYLPTESLMTGVKGTAQLALDLLVNAVTLPAKAFEMMTGEKDVDDKDDDRDGF